MRFRYCRVFFCIILGFYCLQSKASSDQGDGMFLAAKTAENAIPENSVTRKVKKVTYYLENSASMFGYVNGFTAYVDVLTELAEKPRFVEERTAREFFFINGGETVQITPIGNNPTVLKNKLNVAAFKCGDTSKSNLNAMFQKALAEAKGDNITLLISDGIYDLGKTEMPLNTLATEGRETRSRFIERLNMGDVQTIMIKLSSHFEGNYYPVSGGRVSMSQQRPFYVWIFGKTDLLNEYFDDEYLKKLKGFDDFARFLKLDDLKFDYKAITDDRIGEFRVDRNNKGGLTDLKLDRNGRGFSFTIAVDFSNLPFSDSYLTSVSNYNLDNDNFEISDIRPIGGKKIYGLSFQPTHLIRVSAARNPYGQLEISLLNNQPNWIEKTNIDDEKNIAKDTTHTFGFKFLTNAICEAYQYSNKENSVVKLNFELTK